MFQRGRIDHFALNVADAETFERLRSDRVERGASDGIVTDFGIMRVLSFTDPDGHTVELAHWVGGEDPSQIAHETAVGIGYWTAPEAQRKGLATRAVRLLSRWAVQHAEVIRIEALLDPCNVASRRVGENSGFQPEGQLRLYLELNLHP